MSWKAEATETIYAMIMNPTVSNTRRVVRLNRFLNKRKSTGRVFLYINNPTRMIKNTIIKIVREIESGTT